PERRAAFAQKMTERLGVPVTPAETPQDAVGGTDIVVIATNTGMNGPIAYEASWMEPGQHVVSIGSTSPFLRELDTACFTAADRIVLDVSAEQLMDECGDAMAADEDERARLEGAEHLAAVVASGTVNAGNDGLTLFKSVGTAAQDLISAKAVYDIALAQGLGTEIGPVVEPKMF
ncbi:MAG TPA: hypothetical protein VFA94_02725, partial [Acidimicrobiales bacterium]|nr:hypothetical protein [Acidimicrobiales bacterium]